MRKLLATSIFAACFAVLASGAVLPDMKFRRLDTRNGLSNSQVNCIYKDTRGFVWIGTPYGLNRYDGYRVHTFYSNARDTMTMRDNYVDQIMEAGDGRLWIKQGMNYCIYDPVTERFDRNVAVELAKMGITGGLDRVYIDKKKRFWVKMWEQGIFIYDPATKKLHQINPGYDDNELNPTYGISDFADVDDNCVVVSTNCGELVCIDGTQGKIKWEDKWMRQNGSLENQDYHLRPAPNGDLWVVTLNFTFVHSKAENRWYTTLPQYLKAHGVEGLPDELMVWDVMFDQHGWLWAATDHEGLFVIDLKEKQLHQYLTSKYDETTISDNTPKNLYEDDKGTVWIGTYKNGANQYREGLSSFKNVELGDVNVALADRRGNYWVGTNDRGIIVYNPRTGEQAQYTTANSPLSSNVMVGGCVASDGTVWFGSYNGGLTHCVPSGEGQQAHIVNYRATGTPDGLANNNVWSVTEDVWHRIWLGTLGSGVQLLDPKTGKFRTWDSSNTKLPSGYMTSLGWTKKGWLLCGTSYYYAILNPKTGRLLTYTFPEDADIPVSAYATTCVMEDSRGLIWQGSTSGVCVFDDATKQLTLLDMSRGLYGSSVTSIVEDQRKTMWVVTDHGVSNVVPQRQDDGTWQFYVRSFNARDGLQQGTYNQRSACVTPDGLVLVGGQGGLDIIDPSHLSDAGGSKERPVFSGLLLAEQPVAVGQEFGGRVILKEALDISHQLTLRYAESNFTIQLGSDGGVIQNHKRFVYKLEGFNDTWIKTSELNPNISYMSLRAGDYTLCVRMLNDDGTIGEVESRLDITILPPLWRRRWAMLVYMLLIAGAALWWRRWFLKRQQKKMKVESLRRDLEKQQWMNEMRLQLAQEQQQQAAADDGTPADAPQATVQAAEPAQPAAPDRQPTDLVDFVRAHCESYVSPVTDKRVKVSFLTAVPQLPIDIDRQQLAAVLDTLFRNAAMFSADDCLISVGVARLASGDAQLQVADNGIGIRDEYKLHAFDPIVNGDGIGLDKVKATVDAHGGTIRIDDNPGGGTIFIITLPVHAEPEVEDAVIIEE